MKALTFEEWYEKEGQAYVEEVVRKSWNAAREGMIPADRAIEVPDVGEWPAGSKGISIRFADYDEEYFDDLVAGWNIKYIPRPVPAWVPKVGDPVFAVFGESTECRFSVARYEGNGRVTWPNGRLSEVGEVDRCKPFDASKIGKPWSEI